MATKSIKTLYYIQSEHIWGEAFFDEDANLVQYNHENDNNFRPEYMNTVIEFFGGKVVELDTELKHIDDASDYEEALGANMALIKRAIGRAKKK